MREIRARLLDELSRCMRCGFCQAVCPIYREEGTEFAVARGKLILIEAVVAGRLSPSPAVAEVIDRCLVCKSCRAACPSGVRTDLIMAMTRELMARLYGRGWVKEAILAVAGHRPLATGLALAGEALWGVATVGLPDAEGLSKIRLPGEHRYPRPNHRTLAEALRHRRRRGAATDDRSIDSLRLTPPKARGRVLLFVGCLVNYMLHPIGTAAVDVLLDARYEVVMPAAAECCGTPLYVNGKLAGATRAARRNLSWWRMANGRASPSEWPLLFVCPSCAEMWRSYPETLEGEERATAVAAAGTVVDVSAFLWRDAPDWVGALGRGGTGGGASSITYHDPCHLAQAQGIRSEPRGLLRALPGATFREMEDPGGCCGSGGTFGVFHQALARRIGRRKVDGVIGSGAGLVATGCPACRLQIGQEFAVAGRTIPVRHTVELVAEAVRGRAAGFRQVPSGDRGAANPRDLK